MFVIDDIVIDEDILLNDELVNAYCILIMIKRTTNKLKKELNI